MSTPTPGPWRWMNDETLVADYGRRRVVLTSYDGLTTCGEDGLLRPLLSTDPNARLMETAPELLAALKHMEVCQSCAQADWRACPGGRDALAAIAKAEGR